MTSITPTPPESSTGVEEVFGYDLLNRLTSIARTSGPSETLRYDPFGMLLLRQTGTQVTAYLGGRATASATLLVGCSAPSCGMTLAAGDVHLLVGGARVVSVRQGASPRTVYLYRDRLGSVVATTLAGGVKGASYRYGVYGALEASSGDTGDAASELGYAGATRLSGGLLLMGLRVYSPATRGFLQTDPLLPFKYDYTDGDPVNRVDPTGMAPVDADEDPKAPTGGQPGPESPPPPDSSDFRCQGTTCSESIDVVGNRDPTGWIGFGNPRGGGHRGRGGEPRARGPLWRTVSIGFGAFVGVTLHFSWDRFNRGYFGIGPSVGKSFLVTASYTESWANWLALSPAQEFNWVAAMNTGWGASALAGVGSAVGGTWSPSLGSPFNRAAVALDTGLSTPALGVGAKYSWYVYDFGNRSGE